jgi:hypothetical protein
MQPSAGSFSHGFPFFANNLINLLSKKITTQFCYTKQLGRLDKTEAIPASPGQALLLLLLLIIFYLSLQRKREGEKYSCPAVLHDKPGI